MSNRIFKNYQVNIGMPFQIKTPLNFDTIKKVVEGVREEEAYKEPVQMETAEDVFEKAREEARFILMEAELEARRLIEDAEKEALAKASSLEEEALRKGYEDGVIQAKKEHADLIQEAEFIKEHARVEYKEVLESMESDIVETILDIAKTVIGKEMDANRENVLLLVQNAFEKCTNRENIVLRVSREDYTVVEANRDRLLSAVEGIGELEIKQDGSLKSGACVVETLYGSIDAGIQTKIKMVEDAFRQAVGKD